MSTFAKRTSIQWVGLVLGPLAATALAVGPSALHRVEGFGARPAFAAAVTIWMAIWWFTEAVPIALTAGLPLLLHPLLGIYGHGLWADALESAEPYVDAYIFLFLGGMAIGAAMETWSLHRRVALHIMRAIGTQPKRLLLGMLVATAAVSLWISNTATAVMMMPIAMALLAQLESARGGRKLESFGAALMLAVAYAANIGGIGTKIGTATNSIFVGFLSEKLGHEMNFLTFMAAGLPFVVIFIPLIWLVLWRLGRADAIDDGRGRALLDENLAALGPMSAREKQVALVFTAACLLWVFGDVLRPWIAHHVPLPYEGFRFLGKHYEAAVAVGAALILLALRALTFGALRRLPWGTLLLLGGSFAMASGIEGSGLSTLLVLAVRPLAELPFIAQLALGCLATIALSAIASNTATINLILNVLPPSLPLLTSTALAASCDFALPAGTPPNAIVFGSGYIRLPTMMKTGVWLDLAAAAVLTLYGYFYLSPLLS